MELLNKDWEYTLSGKAYNLKTFEILSAYEIEMLEKLQQEQLKIVPKYNEWQWGEIFKESPGPAITGLKQRIEADKLKIRELMESKKIYKRDLILWKDRQYLQWLIDNNQERIEDLRREIRSWETLINHLKARGKDMVAGEKVGITQGDIQMAKDVPMAQLVEGEFKHTGNTLVGRCPFHTERTGSFTVFLKNNTWYCFSCGIGGDTIAYMQKKTGGNFINVVKFLIGKP